MCTHCGDQNHKIEKLISRRDMLRYIGAGAVGLTLGTTPLISGLAAGMNRLDDIENMNAVQNGKVKKLTFLQTTDIHGQVLTHPEAFWENGKMIIRNAGGMSRISTLFKKIKMENLGNVVTVDCGDCYQGSALTALSQGEAMIPIVNSMGYDISLPGNWEVVYGPNQLIHLMKEYNHPVICSNMYWGSDGLYPNEDLFPKFYIKEMDGVRVGFIGYNDPLTKKRQAPSYHRGIEFSLPEDSVQKLVYLLKEKYKCHIVIMLAHLGLAQQVDLANKSVCDGVDFILGGDTHERTRTAIEAEYSKVGEAGSFGSFVGRLDLFVEDGKVKDYNYDLLTVWESDYPEDIGIKQIVDKERKPYLSVMEREIGQTTTPLFRYCVLENPMDNMITDAVKEATGADIGISNGFRFCPPILPGKITMDHLYSMLPTIAALKMGTVTGQQIWDWMENELETVFSPIAKKRVGGWVVRYSGMKVKITIGNSYNKIKGLGRLQEIWINGETIVMEKEYSIAACDREGEDLNIICRINNAKNVQILDMTNYQAVINFLQTHSPISYDIEGRCFATDTTETVLSTLPGTNYKFY